MKKLSILLSLAFGLSLNAQAQNQSSLNFDDKISNYSKQIKTIQMNFKI